MASKFDAWIYFKNFIEDVNNGKIDTSSLSFGQLFVAQSQYEFAVIAKRAIEQSSLMGTNFNAFDENIQFLTDLTQHSYLNDEEARKLAKASSFLIYLQKYFKDEANHGS